MYKLRQATFVFLLLGAVAIFVAACDSGEPAPVGTPTPDAATELLISEAISNTNGLKSYKYTLGVLGTGVSASAELQGEYVAPDRGHLQGIIDGKSFQQLVVGSTVYVMGDGAAWVPRPTPQTPVTTTEAIISADTLVAGANPLPGFAAMLKQAGRFENKGEETIAGRTVSRYDYRLDVDKYTGGLQDELKEMAGGQLPDIGGGSVWVDPVSKQLYKFEIASDLDQAMILQRLQQEFSLGKPAEGSPTPTVVPPSELRITMIISEHNSPSVTVPEP